MNMNQIIRLMLVPVVLASMWLASLVGIFLTCPPDDSGEMLRTFDSKAELLDFMEYGEGSEYTLLGPKAPAKFSEMTYDSGGSVPYSETNVQVAGVDEPDVVKTDGEFVYISSRHDVKIVRAAPPEEMEVVFVANASELFGLDDTGYGYVSELFVSGDRLVVLGTVYTYMAEVKRSDYTPPRTVVSVLDLSDISGPVPMLTVGMSGVQLTSRMVGDIVYMLAQETLWHADEESVLPDLWEDRDRTEVGLSSVKYDPDTRYADSFVNILALDISSGGHSSISIVAGFSSTVYMSAQSLCFTVQKWRGEATDNNGLISPQNTRSTMTTIYKISIDGLQMTPVARGDVHGWLLNQFSMDEHSGYLRVATTTSWMGVENAVYVLDEDLDVVGELEHLAPSERIFSARFVGETLYLVTFRQTDPLFVIDLSDPARPKVVGELKIPGFSRYLHPVDDSHVLGIGQDDGQFKVSLFDVSDPAAPAEKSKFVVDDAFYSEALYDHKAVLFDLERELLVIPGYEWSYEWAQDDENWFDVTYSYYQKPVAHVFRISLSDGISLRGIVAHDMVESPLYSMMTRALYIGDCLYTLSDLALQANLLEDLSYVGKVPFPEVVWNYAH